VKSVKKEGEGKRKGDPGKKKAFAFFYIKILSSFPSLFSFMPQKSAALLRIFMSGLRQKNHGISFHFEEYLRNLEQQYKWQQESRKQSSYHSYSQGNYNYSGSYYTNQQSNYTEDEKEKLKLIYHALSKTFHPDITKDNGEMMKFINKLKEEWGLMTTVTAGRSRRHRTDRRIFRSEKYSLAQ
jgi:hypothetical protein